MNFTSLQLTHDALIFIVVLVGIAIAKAGFPIFVRGWTHHKVVLLMILAFIAQLANLHMLTSIDESIEILPHKICTVV